MAQVIDGLGYREWQRRNSDRFKQLSRDEQKQARTKGYRNVGWENVRKSWELIRPSPSDTFDRTSKDLSDSVALQMYAALGDLREKSNVDEFNYLWDKGNYADAFAIARTELEAFKKRNEQLHDENEAAFRRLRELDAQRQQDLEDDI